MKKSLSIATVAAVAGYRSKTGCSPIDTSGILNVFGDGSCKATYQFNGVVTELSGLYPSTSATNTFATGKFGQAASFNGSQYVYIGDYSWANIYSISLWFKPTNGSSVRTILGSQNVGTNTDNIILGIYNNTLITYNRSIVNLKTSLPLNVWHHVVINKIASNKYDFYLNNTKVGSNITNDDASLDLKYIGSDNSGPGIFANEGFIGQIDQVRMFNKVLTSVEVNALYTEIKYQDPTICDPYWSYTSLLLSGDGTNGSQSFTDLTGKNVLQTSGNAQISTENKKFGTGSMYFDGNGDYIYAPYNSNFSFGTGDFTIECWVNPLSTGVLGIFQVGVYASDNLTISILDGFFKIYINNSTFLTNGTIPVPINSWSHIAVVRKNGTGSVFLNGILKASATFAYSISTVNSFAYIGVDYQTIPNKFYYFNGYIDDLRVTKGVARYTSNFTVPAKALPAQGV